MNQPISAIQVAKLWRAENRRWCGLLGWLFIAIVMIVLSAASPMPSVARTWHVPADAPTIQAAIDSATAGDEVLVAPGTYLEHDIVMTAGVWVHSEQGPGVTTVDAGGYGVGFDCAGLDQRSVIEGFEILNGRADGADELEASGGGVRCAQGSLEICDCIITDCTAGGLGGGIYAYESDMEIRACTVTICSAELGGGGVCVRHSAATIADCEILDNLSAGAGGIYAGGPEVTIVRCVVSGNGASWGIAGGILCGSPALTIRECLVTGNRANVMGDGFGLCIIGGFGSISGCTLANNTGWSHSNASLEIQDSDIGIERTIIALNEGRALRCLNSQISIGCCDVYGNTEGDDLCGTELGGNFSEDPLFCNAENGDYTLDGCSPCLPGNHPEGADCGLIGALGQGCGATGVEETSWGRVKALYRR